MTPQHEEFDKYFYTVTYTSSKYTLNLPYYKKRNIKHKLKQNYPPCWPFTNVPQAELCTSIENLFFCYIYISAHLSVPKSKASITTVVTCATYIFKSVNNCCKTHWTRHNHIKDRTQWSAGIRMRICTTTEDCTRFWKYHFDSMIRVR